VAALYRLASRQSKLARSLSACILYLWCIVAASFSIRRARNLRSGVLRFHMDASVAANVSFTG
jgi:hypothetical protein